MVSAGAATARADGLHIDIRREALVPGGNGQIPVEVTFPTDFFSEESEVEFLTDIFMGVRPAFVLDEGYVNIVDEFKDGLANPVRVTDFENPHENEEKLMIQFRTQDIFFPDGFFDDGEPTMGLGVFPNGVDDIVPRTHWAPDGINGPVG